MRSRHLYLTVWQELADCFSNLLPQETKGMWLLRVKVICASFLAFAATENMLAQKPKQRVRCWVNFQQLGLVCAYVEL